jgi:hypothetical protein
MDWFESLTGFHETAYEDTRAKLEVEGDRLHSLVNGKSYGIGALELVSLQTLREWVKSGRALPGRLKVSVVRGDVQLDAPSAGECRRAVSGGVPVQPSGDGLAHGDPGGRRHPLPARPHARPGMRDRRRRGDNLSQLVRGPTQN